jgi:hypothetical protein
LNFKNKIKEFFIGKGKLGSHVPGILKDIKQPEKLCLFFAIQSQQELDKIDKILKSIPNPPKTLVAFVLNRAEKLTGIITNNSIFCFELTDFNIFGKKSAVLEKNFSENSFDLLISFAEAQDMVSQKLISEIKSSFKIGIINPDNKEIFDLVIDYKNQKDYEGYYKQVIHYLSVLNITMI